MSNRKIISRPITALLSCVALVFAMLMVVLAVPMGKASASSGYVPKRTMSITGNSSEAEAKIVMTGGSSLGEGKKLTVKGYFKVTDFGVVNADQGPKVEVGKTVVTGNTDGWVPFEQEYTASDSNWLVFHFWYASGTLSLADITFTDADGKVVYDMATDSKLIAGEVKGFPSQFGIWYFGYYSGASNVSAAIDPVVAPAHEPERTITIHDAAPQVNAKAAIILKTAESGKEYTLKGYYKLDNFASLNDAQGPKVNLGGIAVTADTDGWQPFEIAYAGGYTYFEFWYASGDLSLADVQIVDPDGAVVYDLATDASLEARTGSTATGDQGNAWWFGEYAGAAGFSFDVDPVTTTTTTTESTTAATTETSKTTITTASTVTTTETPSTVTTEPTTAPTIPVDPSGYVPNRSVSVVSTTDENPTMRMYLMYDYYMLDGPYYLVGKVKVDGLTAQSGADEAKSYIEFAYSYTDSVEVAAYTEDTNGWIDLKGNDGKLISFDNLSEETTGDMELVFGTKGAAGTFSVADLKIVDAAGNIVYSMANDATLYGKGDIRKCSKSLCIWDAWDVDTNNPTSQFPIRTRGDAEYIPNNVLSIDVPEGSKTNNPIIFMSTNNELFTAGETYTLTGRMKVDITGEVANTAGERANANLGGPGFSLHYGTTGGWVAITKDDGTPITFEGTAADNEQRLTWLMWYANGSLSLADIEITDSEGNVVYSMATDPALQENKTIGMWEGSALLRPAAFGVVDQLSFGIKVNANPVQHTAADYVVPTFEETVDITDPSTSTSTSDADTTNSTGDVTDPSATNGTDPSNPNTGDSNVLLTIAGLAAVLALAGAFLTLRKKESAE